MQPAKINYKVYQGSTFKEVFRWESETKTYLKIQTIDKSAPCVVTTQTSPQLPVGWRFWVRGAGGMKEINTATDDAYYIATNVNQVAKTIEINQVNSLGFTTYTTGGVVEYNNPIDLLSYSARMQIRPSLDSTEVIYSGTTDNGSIVLDNVYKTITITVPATSTTNFTFTTAVYSMELYDNTGVVIPFLTGNMTLVPEVTR